MALSVCESVMNLIFVKMMHQVASCAIHLDICANNFSFFVNYAASVWVNYLFVRIMQRRRTKRRWSHLVP